MNSVKKLVLFILILLMFFACIGCSKDDSVFNKVLENIDDWNDKIEKALSGESSKAKRIVYNFLDKDSVEISSLDVQKVCDQMLLVVGDSPAIELKDKIVELRKEKNKLDQENDELKEEYYLSTDKQDKIEKQISKNFTKIEKIDSQILEKKEEMRTLFAADGVSLSDKEIEVITGESYGNDVLSLCIVSLNISSVLNQYRENILEKSGSSSSFNLYMKYYKLYRLAVLSQMRALDVSLTNNANYRNKLNQLLSENEQLMESTKKQMESDTTHASHYSANLKSQEINRDVMNNFMTILNSYKDVWTQKYQELSVVDEMITNTINTANISSEVSALLGETLEMIDSLDSIALGEILVFDNSGLETQFQELSSKLSENT